MSKTTMLIAHNSTPPPESKVAAAWVTALFPSDFSGEVPVVLVVKKGVMELVFPSSTPTPSP